MQVKPKLFVENGFVFVSTNYRLLPSVDMETIIRDVAKSIGWVRTHIAEYGGDPKRLYGSYRYLPYSFKADKAEIDDFFQICIFQSRTVQQISGAGI